MVGDVDVDYRVGGWMMVVMEATWVDWVSW